MESVERRGELGASLGWALLGTALAVLLGLATGVSVQIAIALLVLGVTGLALARWPESLVVILSLSVIFEALTLGGLTISRLIAPLALAVILIQVLRGRTSAPAALAPLAWIIAYSLWAFASFFWTLSPEGTAFGVQSLMIALVYFASFALLVKRERTVTLVLWTFALGTLLIGFVSLAQVSGRVALFPWTMVEGRAQGAVANANIFAAVQLVAMPMAIVLFGAHRGRIGRLVLLASILAVPASVMASLSRGGTIGLVLTLAVFVIAPAGTFIPRRGKRIILIALVVSAAALLSRPTFGHDVTDRLGITHSPSATVSATSSNTGSGRTDIWITAWQEAKLHPFLGIGYGAFKPRSNALFFETPGFNPDEKVIRVDGSEVHNTYLASLTELGPAGLIFLLGLLVSTVVELRRTARRFALAGNHYLARVANAVLLSLVVWQVTGIFGEYETARPGWIMIGLTVALSTISRRQPPRAPETVG